MVKKKVIKLVRRPKATLKQKKLVKAISDTISKHGPAKSVKKLMVEVGYAESTAKRSTEITKSKSFLDLLEAAGVTDDLLAGKIKEGIQLSCKHTNSPRFIEMGLKLKKHMTPLGEEVIDAFKQMVQFHIPAHKELPTK